MMPSVLVSPALAPPSPSFGHDGHMKTLALSTMPPAVAHADELVARHACRQWTGPMRAIVPLPRRLMQSVPSDDRAQHRRIDSAVVGPPCRTRYVRDVDVNADVGVDMDTVLDVEDDASEVEDEEDEDARAANENDATWCCSYESITAAKGLDAWSFEELRVECYAQSLIARGTKPPHVDKPSLVIPPAFVPRVMLQTRVGFFPKQ